jgi:hypothetical protein
LGGVGGGVWVGWWVVRDEWWVVSFVLY